MAKLVTSFFRIPGAISVALAVPLFGGCVSYSPAQLSQLSAVELSELRDTQGFNLSTNSKAAMRNKLERRSEQCATYQAVLAQRREAALYREMYGKHDDP
jgi:hypothetical protein